MTTVTTDPKLDLPEKILMYSKKLPSHESLFVIQNYNFELREILNKHQELLKELEFNRSKAENELKSIEFTVDNLKIETEKVKLQLQADSETDENLRKKIRLAEERKLISAKEHMSKMAEFRKQLFSNVDVNEEAIALEIEDISSQQQLLLHEIDDTKLVLNNRIQNFHATCATSDAELTKIIQILKEEISDKEEVERECKVLENEIQKISVQIKNL